MSSSISVSTFLKGGRGTNRSRSLFDSKLLFCKRLLLCHVFNSSLGTTDLGQWREKARGFAWLRGWDATVVGVM